MTKKEAPPCDARIFSDGKPLLFADTYHCGSDGFEEWVQSIAKASGQQVDWHYSGGVAQVLYIGDRQAIMAAIEKIECPARIMRIVEPDAPGLYRRGVTAAPDDASIGFYAGGDESTFA